MKTMSDIYFGALSFDNVIAFGKYKGYTFKYIYENDPNYLLWLFTKTDFCAKNNISDELLQGVLHGES